MCVCVCVCVCEREREEPLSLAHVVLTTITTTTLIEGNNVVQKKFPSQFKSDFKKFTFETGLS